MNSSKTLTIIFLLSAALICLSCGNSIPQISGINSQQNFLLTPETEKISYFLNVYINADDKDGIEDLLNLYLLSDERELLWRSYSDDWVLREQSGIQWRGVEKLVLPENDIFPSGTYRLILKDQAGEQVTDEIIIRPVTEDMTPDMFPYIEFSEDRNTITLESPYDYSIISFYDKSDELLQAYRSTAGSLVIKELERGDDVSRKYRTIYVSTYNDRIGAALMSGPYTK